MAQKKRFEVIMYDIVMCDYKCTFCGRILNSRLQQRDVLERNE